MIIAYHIFCNLHQLNSCSSVTLYAAHKMVHCMMQYDTTDNPIIAIGSMYSLVIHQRSCSEHIVCHWAIILKVLLLSFHCECFMLQCMLFCKQLLLLITCCLLLVASLLILHKPHMWCILWAWQHPLAHAQISISLSFLLNMYNQIWNEDSFPSESWEVIVVLILKAGKDHFCLPAITQYGSMSLNVSRE
jgi:hypothetical protein